MGQSSVFRDSGGVKPEAFHGEGGTEAMSLWLSSAVETKLETALRPCI